MLIKKMNENHISEIYDLEKECFSHPWSKNLISESIHNNKYVFVGAFVNDSLIGYGGMNIITDEVYITNIAVKESFRNQGIGSKISSYLADEAETHNCKFISLEVRESNIPAVKAYKKTGFKVVGLRKNFYTDPKENALIMTKFFGVN